MFSKLDFGFCARHRFRHLLEPENPNSGEIKGSLGETKVGIGGKTTADEVEPDTLWKTWVGFSFETEANLLD